MAGSPKNIYIVYDTKETPLIVGTAEECATYLGIQVDSFKNTERRIRQGKCEGAKYMAYRMWQEVGV